MSYDHGYLQDYCFEDMFDFGNKFSLPENDFGFPEEVPEFDLDSPIDDLLMPAKEELPQVLLPECSSDTSSCKKASETQETLGTESVSQAKMEEILQAQKHETCSVFSFDSFEVSPNPIAVPSAFSTYQKILLKMIDEESLNFLLKEPAQLDATMAEFLACNVEVMTKASCKGLQEGETPFAFVHRINELLRQTTTKRKDQKLRMIFNKIVKMLVKKSGKKECQRESKATKMDSFYSKYAPNSKIEFEDCIKNCKFPSKKKLRSNQLIFSNMNSGPSSASINILAKISKAFSATEFSSMITSKSEK